MADTNIVVEVAFAKPEEQVLTRVTLPKAATVEQAIATSGVLKQFPELEQTKLKVGIFGSSCSLQKKLEAGDRVEIYRPLCQHPMVARRSRI